MKESTPNLQREYQRRILSDAGLDPNQFEEMIKVWWRNPTNPNSLRLTTYGLSFFTKNLKQQTYTIKLDADAIKNKHLLQLERLFTAPYYIKNTALVVFSEQDAIMLQLHAGDLSTYLDNLQTNS